MDHSEYIAKLIGPAMLAIAAFILINRSQFERMAEQFAENYAVIVITGMGMLLGGIAIVQAHNVWVGDWRVLITVFGWLAGVGGAFRIVFPNAVADMAEGFIHNRTLTSAVAVGMALAGGVLTAMGYGSHF